MADEYQRINHALIKIYNGILWIEEKKLRESTFCDLTIKEMHAIDAISMYDHQTASQEMCIRDRYSTPVDSATPDQNE